MDPDVSLKNGILSSLDVQVKLMNIFGLGANVTSQQKEFFFCQGALKRLF